MSPIWVGLKVTDELSNGEADEHLSNVNSIFLLEKSKEKKDVFSQHYGQTDPH